MILRVQTFFQLDTGSYVGEGIGGALEAKLRLSFGKVRILSNLQLSTLISKACVQLWSVTTSFLVASQLIDIFGNGVQVQSRRLPCT